jgi:hypothetical protein
MATAALVNHDIEIGRRIVAALTRGGVPVSVDLRAYIPRLEEWQFFIATPFVDSKGPIGAYKEVEKALQKYGTYEDVPLRRIYLRSPKDRTLRLLEKQSRGIPHEDFRVVNAPISGSYVEDAYVYSGSVHLVQLQKTGSNGQEAYLAIYTPYAGPGGAAPNRQFRGTGELRTFLEEQLHVAVDVIDSALRDLSQTGSASIPNVELKTAELRRLGLA